MVNPGRRFWSITILFASLWTLCLGGESAAALDPELKVPYHLEVVLIVADHRMLTAGFQNQLETDIRDQLQLALGKLGNVKVLRGHEIVKDIREKGLQAALDGWNKPSTVQTHVVQIDFAEGQYHVQTAYHDGITGLNSPLVRRAVLSDRQRVGDAAAQLVRKSFGVVGTFEKVSGNEATITIKGGGLVDSLGPWVKRGEVFAVVRVTEHGGQTRAVPIEWAVMEVLDVLPSGQIRCHYFCRYSQDRALNAGGSTLGFRCLKLNTIQGPVRVRLVNKETQEFLDGVKVEASSNADFKGKITAGTTYNGRFDGALLFSHVAYIRIRSADVAFPVPILDDRTVVCWMSPNKAAEKLSEIEQRRDRWVRWHWESLALADQRLAQLNIERAPQETLRLGRLHLEAIASEAKRLAAEKEELLLQAKKMPLDLSEGKQIEQAMAKRQEQLAKFLDDLDRQIKVADSDETRKINADVQRAQFLEKQAEFEKAIEIYEAVLKTRTIAEVKKHLDQLKVQWTVKDNDHAQARQFLYETWPKLVLTDLQSNVKNAKRCFQTCQQVGDRLAPLKLQLANVQHAKALSQEWEILRKQPDSEDVRARTKSLIQLGEDLRILRDEVQAWLGADKEKGK